MRSLGIALAFGALLTWGFGDYFIQLSTRRIGAIKSLFFVGLGGFILLLPFVLGDLPKIFSSQNGLLLLLVGVAVAIIFAPINFEALRRGKISVVEPIIGTELLVTAILGIAFLGEKISGPQFLLILIICVGVVLSVSESRKIFGADRVKLEAGAILAILTALGLAMSNLIIGLASRATSPLLAVWFTHTAVGLACFIVLVWQGKAGQLIGDFKKYNRVIAFEAVFDVLAWVCFASATIFLPISLAAAISGSYVVLAVMLGVMVSREKLKPHQAAGVALAIVGEIFLSFLIR